MYLQLNENNFEYKRLSEKFGANHKFLVLAEKNSHYILKDFPAGDIFCDKDCLKVGCSIFKLVNNAQLELEF